MVRLGAEDADECGCGVAVVGVQCVGYSFASFAPVKGQIVTTVADGSAKRIEGIICYFLKPGYSRTVR